MLIEPASYGLMLDANQRVYLVGVDGMQVLLRKSSRDLKQTMKGFLSIILEKQ
jgi:hypothetical protein